MAMRKFTVIGVFDERASAEQAIESLYNAGFPSENIRYSGDSATGGFLDNIKNLFTGHGAHSDAVLHDLTEMGLPQEQARYYAQEHNAGRTIVTVVADEREQEARTILRSRGGYDHSMQSGRTADNRDASSRDTRQPGYNPQAGTMPAGGFTNTTGTSQTPSSPRTSDRTQPAAGANMPNMPGTRTPDAAQPFAGAKAPDMPAAKKPDMSPPSAEFKGPDISTPGAGRDINRPQAPDLSTPRSPDVSRPKTPDMSPPAAGFKGPDISAPGAGRDINRHQTPDLSRPKAPDLSQPSSGSRTPDVTRPAANTDIPDVGRPRTPDIGNQKIPDMSQPSSGNRMPDATIDKTAGPANTRLPDRNQSGSGFKAPDVSAPRTPDMGSQKIPDVSQPSTSARMPDTTATRASDATNARTPDMSMPKTPDISTPRAGSTPQPGVRIPDANMPKAPNMPPTAPGTRTPDMTSPRTPDMSPPASGTRGADIAGNRGTEAARPDAGSIGGLRGTTGSGNVTPGYEESVIQRRGPESGEVPGTTSAQAGETMRVPIRGERVEGDKTINTPNEVAANRSSMAENQRNNDPNIRNQTSPTNMRKKVRDDDDIDEGELPIDSI